MGDRRTPPKEPVKFALAFFDRQVVDTGDAPLLEASVVELPILVTITTKPLARMRVRNASTQLRQALSNV
jgi:hypothetical protein